MGQYPHDLDNNNWINTEVWIDTPEGVKVGTVIHQAKNVLSIWTGDLMLTTLAERLVLEGTVYTITPDWE